jgi:hypothetical protein
MVDAGRDSNPGHPVRKGDGALVLFEAGEHLHEDLLGEILLGHLPREMGAHNADNHRVELIHEFSRSGLVALADALQAASKIKGRWIRHKAMELAAYTIEKTRA